MAQKWVLDYGKASQSAQALVSQINERNNLDRSSPYFSGIDADVRSSLATLVSESQRLQQELTRSRSSYVITQMEADRRQGQMNDLETKRRQMERLLEDSGNAGFRTTLRDPEPSFSGEMNASRFRQVHAETYDDQERGLEALSSAISRQKNMALTIGSEVDNQNDLIDDIQSRVEVTDGRVKEATSKIFTVDRKSGTCYYWMVILLLFLSIIVVVAVPYKGKP